MCLGDRKTGFATMRYALSAPEYLLVTVRVSRPRGQSVPVASVMQGANGADLVRPRTASTALRIIDAVAAFGAQAGPYTHPEPT